MSDKKADALPPEDTTSNAGVQIGKVEGEQVNIGDITGGDKTTVSGVHSSTVAAGKGSAAATKGGIAVSLNVEGDLVISVGHTEVAAIPRILQIAIVVITISIIFLVSLQSYRAYSGAQPTPIAPMTGDFNIAVAEFQVVGLGDGLDDANELAQTFANAIEREMSKLMDEIDQRIEVRPPTVSKSIPGATAEERAQAADNLAEDINADVIIYGIIEVDGEIATIKPEFYVKNDEFDAAAEVTGQYRMGSEIQIDKIDSLRRKQEAGDELSDRFRALTFIIYGLSDYVIGDYDAAELNFNEALKIKAWDNPDVIYVMLGNAALKHKDWEKAEEYYYKALDNPLYSRAYAGLGSVFYAQAALEDIQSDSYDNVNIDLLNQAIQTYQRALDPDLDHPPLADVTTKASFGLGQAHLLKAIVEDSRGNSEATNRDLGIALQSFRTVIQNYEADNKRIEELAAHAHARMGLTYRLTGQLDIAISEYKQAVNLLPHLERTKKDKAAYEAAIGAIYVELGRTSKAIEWYERAVEDAVSDSDRQNQYRKALDRLREQNTF